MFQSVFSRWTINHARHQTNITAFARYRNISLNSGIQSGLRAEQVDRRDSRSDRGLRRGVFRGSSRGSDRGSDRGSSRGFDRGSSRGSSSRPDRGVQALRSLEDLPERGPRSKDDVPESFSRPSFPHANKNSQARWMARGHLKLRKKSDGQSVRSDDDQADARFRSGKKPGKWERQAVAAGASAEEWRDLRAVRVPGTGPTHRFSNPDKIWNKFKEPGMADDKPRRPSRKDFDPSRSKPRFDSQSQEESAGRLAPRTSRSNSFDAPQRFGSTARPDFEETRKPRATKRYPANEEQDAYDGPPSRFQLSAADSELVFGRNAVMSVLRSKRRKLHKLYLHERFFKKVVDDGEDKFLAMERLASDAGVDVQHVGDDWLLQFDRASHGKPHNGAILEASPVPTPLVKGFGECSSDESGPYYTADLDGAKTAKVRYPSADLSNSVDGVKQFPLVIFCDKLTDVGNFGALLRSAYWFKAAGVVFPVRGSAKPDTVTIKTSAGAVEGVNLFTTNHALTFVTNCRSAGWKIVAAMPPSAATPPHKKSYKVPDLQPRLAQLRQQGPVLLLLGGEEEGITTKMSQVATARVSITGQGENELGIDSLNVSVAASLILAEFNRPTQSAAEGELESGEEESDSEASDAAIDGNRLW